MIQLRFRLAQLAYDVGTSLLFLPTLIAMGIGCAGVVLSTIESRGAVMVPLLALEPATAQVTFATLAGAMMTVISVVYSVLLVALSLASIQFSTRVLVGIVRDRPSQVVLGLFLGTFLWQLIALRAVHLDPPYVPPFTAAAGVALVVLSLLALVLFIDRVIHNIQANHLVNTIAVSAEAVIDEVFPPSTETPVDATWPEPPADARVVRSERSGYIQLVSIEEAQVVAQAGLSVHLLRPIGAFVPAGVPLWAVSPPERCTAEAERQLRDAVDLGSIRTSQEDAEWGFRQIVDIGLKAISPAVNDPSTGATCIDHLSRLLIRAGQRGAPRATWAAGTGQVVIPAVRFSDLVDLAFDQLRQYGRADLAIALRQLKALGDVAECVSHREGLVRIARQARDIDRALHASFPDEDLAELDRRVARVMRLVAR